nr:ABC transporter permease [Kingella potus]
MRTLKNILTLMLKEFRSVLTDPVLMVLIAYIFTATITQMAQVSSDVKNATVGIIDLDRSVLSMRIRDAIQPPYFKPPQDIRREDADEMMDKGEILFVLEIPPGFQRDTEAGRSPKMQLLIDATSMTQSGVGSSYLTQIANRETNAFAGRVQPDIVVPVINTKFNPNGESSWFMPTSQIGTMAFMLLMLLASSTVIRERERGTIEHLLVMPVNAFELMMGKILANGAVILVAVPSARCGLSSTSASACRWPAPSAFMPQGWPFSCFPWPPWAS